MTERHSSAIRGGNWLGPPEDALVRVAEVWYSHASFFAEPIESLKAVARRLVESDVAYAVFSSDGTAWWAEPPVLREDWWGARRVGYSQSAQVWLPKSDDDLVVKAGVDASRFSIEEQQLFNDTFRESTPYIRLFCDACGLQIESPDSTVMLRPQIKLYGNGVMLIHLVLEWDEQLRFAELIGDLVNMQSRTARNAVVPPGVLLAADELSIIASTKGVRNRRREIRNRRRDIAAMVAEHVTGEAHEQHRWALGVSKAPSGRWMDATTLHDLHAYYQDGVALCVNLPHGLRQGSVRGHSSLKNPFSVFWQARPCVHLVDSAVSPADYLVAGSAPAQNLGRLLARSAAVSAPARGGEVIPEGADRVVPSAPCCGRVHLTTMGYRRRDCGVGMAMEASQ